MCVHGIVQHDHNKRQKLAGPQTTILEDFAPQVRRVNRVGFLVAIGPWCVMFVLRGLVSCGISVQHCIRSKLLSDAVRQFADSIMITVYVVGFRAGFQSSTVCVQNC